MIYPDGKRVNYVFDAANRLSTVTDWGNRVTTYAYDAASLLSGITNANGTTTAFDYDFAQRLISMNNKKSDQTVISSYNFTLDGVGNRTNVNATEPITTGINQPNVNYTYNAANQIQTAGATSFTSDDNGNLKTQTTGATTINYNYDFEDRLTNVSDGATTAQYIYNGDGQRMARISGGVTTRFVLDPTARLPRVLAETDASGNIRNYYTHGLGLIARVRLNGQAFQYHFDQRGSTVAITNASQTIVNRYTYDAFGLVTAQSEQTTNSFKYMGQFGVTAEPFDLLFASRRFYSPTLGRFLTKDEAEPEAVNSQTFNEYIYSLNNPIVLIDPSGLSGERDGNSSFSLACPSDKGNSYLFGCNLTKGLISKAIGEAVFGRSLGAEIFGKHASSKFGLAVSILFDALGNYQTGKENNQDLVNIAARTSIDANIRFYIFAATSIGAAAILTAVSAPAIAVVAVPVVLGIATNAIYSTYKEPIQDWTISTYNTIESKVINTVNQAKTAAVNTRNSIVNQGRRFESFVTRIF